MDIFALLQGRLLSIHRARSLYSQVTVYLRAYSISAAVYNACTSQLPNSKSLLFTNDCYTRKCRDSKHLQAKTVKYLQGSFREGCPEEKKVRQDSKNISANVAEWADDNQLR